MSNQLDNHILKQLEEIAENEHRHVNDVAREAISLYLTKRAEEKQFRDDVQRIMNGHRWLLDELAKNDSFVV